MTLMGWASIEKILEALQRAGLSADTPVALVQWGTWSRQRTVTGTLSTAAGKGRAAGLAAPVVAVIGEVVKLREELAWFDNRPLFGKRVLVTRSRTQASRMCELLEDAGAIPVELPAIAIAPPEDFAPLDEAVSRLSSHNWVIFASVNAVDSVFERLDAQGKDSRGLRRCPRREPSARPPPPHWSNAASGPTSRRRARCRRLRWRNWQRASGTAYRCCCPPPTLAVTNWPTGCHNSAQT